MKEVFVLRINERHFEFLKGSLVGWRAVSMSCLRLNLFLSNMRTLGWKRTRVKGVEEREGGGGVGAFHKSAGGGMTAILGTQNTQE